MARRKNISTKKKTKSVPSLKTSEKASYTEVSSAEHTGTKGSNFLSLRNVIIISLLVIVGLIVAFRNYFIVATVNGQPITRWELQDKLTKQFGSQILDSMITERLILDGAKEKGVFVSDEEVNNKIKEIEERIKAQISLDEALAAQGMTRDTFKQQVKLQLTQEKIFANEASPSSKEIDDYIEKNSAMFTNATDAGQVREEVKTMLFQSKLDQLLSTWIEEMRKKTSIKKNI